jgi:hypothetical protein
MKAFKGLENFTPPFRVGRKNKKSVLDANGNSVTIFAHPNHQYNAELMCYILNKMSKEITPSQTNI